ncbi:hypothetical protein DFP72DRAFT_1072727 [Ephemerocybe angulata]|uniref:Uncharacterized protein n=1 Tax=Ephemerocybe angulata TaxID=980116 RepID=A0A8H6HND5_9AGAR|nr:hypothetical protein DFP72DRAFT_1072727 [Tulosesus angulatus]
MVSTALIVLSAGARDGADVSSAFHGIIDLLSVLPCYIELMLGHDTSVPFRFSILRMFFVTTTPSSCATIEVMYLSVRRSQHALLAIGFFVIMILTVFSTCCTSSSYLPVLESLLIFPHRPIHRYFAERGMWDEVMDT